jgi:XTP/dITP diphosphohydrolase
VPKPAWWKLGGSMVTLVIATRNAHKTQEIRDILGPAFCYFTLDDFPTAPLIPEDGTTFDENATRKSAGLARWLLGNSRQLEQLTKDDPGERGPVFVLADDSGLEVDALDGAPGVHSARYAHLGTELPGNAPDTTNNQKLLTALKGIPEERRTARFHCVVAATRIELYNPLRRAAGLMGDVLEKRTILADGICEGRIAFGPSGHGGFGYDPLFIPSGHTDSFAVLGEDVKNELSHRARALRLLKKWLDGMEAGK